MNAPKGIGRTAPARAHFGTSALAARCHQQMGAAVKPAVATRSGPATVAGAQAVTVTVCAWCLRYGRPLAAVRDSATGRWRAVPHEYAHAQTATGRASHGLCDACRPAVLREWELT